MAWRCGTSRAACDAVRKPWDAAVPVAWAKRRRVSESLADVPHRPRLPSYPADRPRDLYGSLSALLGITDLGGAALSDLRRGKNTRHLLTGLLRQSVFGRLAGYEDVNDAERLSRDPVMRAIVDGKGLDRRAASTSQMGRFETGWLATKENLAALTNLSGVWIDRVHARKPPKMIVLDMDSSESPTHGDQEGSAYNGHFGCTCYSPALLLQPVRRPGALPAASRQCP